MATLNIESVEEEIRAAQAQAEELCERILRTSWPAERERINAAIEEAALASSGSQIGYHAQVYIENFSRPTGADVFDPEWGLQGTFATRTIGRWRKYSHDEVISAILKRAKVTEDRISDVQRTSRQILKEFEIVKSSIEVSLDIVLEANPSAALQKIRDEIGALEGSVSREKIARQLSGPRTQYITRDSLAMSQGLLVPPHVSFEASLIALDWPATSARQLVALAQKTLRHLKLSQPKTKMRKSRVFIGHGHSTAWIELRDLIGNRLKLDWDEFDREAVAGISVIERLQQMLDSASFAFVIMTAEDQHSDGTRHARENVIHEAGLFQGKLGFRKAIVLFEQGCTEFSNLHGLAQIRFPKGGLLSKSEAIRQVLEREGLLNA